MIERVGLVSLIVLYLIVLDIMTNDKMYVDTVQNTPCLPYLSLEIDLKVKYDYIYYEWKKIKKLLFTRQELVKLHRYFSHPRNDKLLNFLKLSKPQKVDNETINILE